MTSKQAGSAILVVGWAFVLVVLSVGCVIRWPGPTMFTLLVVSAGCWIARVAAR